MNSRIGYSVIPSFKKVFQHQSWDVVQTPNSVRPSRKIWMWLDELLFLEKIFILIRLIIKISSIMTLNSIYTSVFWFMTFFLSFDYFLITTNQNWNFSLRVCEGNLLRRNQQAMHDDHYYFEGWNNWNFWGASPPFQRKEPWYPKTNWWSRELQPQQHRYRV